MIELEIQGLSEHREGLLVEVGRRVLDGGFVLLRQRLVQDPHGVLLTMVVQGPARKRRVLEAALDACQRFISVRVFPFVEGELRPHFAASRPLPSYTPPRVPASAPARAPSDALPAAKPVAPVASAVPVIVDAVPTVPARNAPASPDEWTASARQPASRPVLASTPTPTPAPVPASPAASVPSVAVAATLTVPPSTELELYDALLVRRPSKAAAAKPEPEPFVELVALEAEVPAVEQALAGLAQEYPRIVPHLQALERAVAAGARESSLRLAGQRVGAWLFEREYALDTGLGVEAALDAIGVPALHAFVEVERHGGELHLRHSPLCAQHGRSGCSFFSGFLEGLLGPAIAPGELSVFPVCCCSYGADECVFAVFG